MSVDIYPPPDDRWIKIGKNEYILPRDKMTKEEKLNLTVKVKKFKTKKIIKSIMDDLIDNVVKIDSCITIQKHIRGYLCRNANKNKEKNIAEWKTKREKCRGVDILPKSELRKLYQTYRNKMIDYHETEMNIGKYLGRIENFPDYISENMVLYALKEKKIKCTWNTDSGDIYYFDKGKKIKGEVKCAQNGPTQLSPSSEWDTLFYIDARTHLFGDIKIYKIENIYHILNNMSVSKTQTIGEQSNQGRRPRSNLINLLSEYLVDDNILFNGKISSLLY
jgi:hypothetical protein